MRHFGVTLLGAGPAGTGVLLAAMKQGTLAALLDGGLCVVERGPLWGRGALGQYAIESDTVSDVLLECLDGPAQTALAEVLEVATTEVVRRHRGHALPLRSAADHLQTVGEALRRYLVRHRSVEVRCETVAVHVRQREEGFLVTVQRSGGVLETFTSDRVISALGGVQDIEGMLARKVAPGVTLGSVRAKVMGSARLLTSEGMGEAARRCEATSPLKVAVIGSSHSAISSVRVLLDQLGAGLGEGAVKLLVRRPPRIFFPSREEAWAAGYDGFSEREVCPTTGRVHRLGGLRLEARRCAMGILGVGEEARERRVEMVSIDAAGTAGVRAVLDEAHLVVAALGYRPRVVTLLDRTGGRVRLQSDVGDRAAVDRWCRVLDGEGRAVTGMYAIGLGSGFVPWGAMGGEPGFVGQTNGVWLYQHHVGAMIVDQVLGHVHPDGGGA